jgi:2-methylcitrate dehydratase PrpD
MENARRGARESFTTRRLAEFALSDPQLTDSTRDATRRILLDTAACAVGGTVTDIGRVLIDWYTSLGGVTESSTVVGGERLPMSAASALNSHLANVLDADETLLNFAHFASVVAMPAICIGEATHASGADLIDAIAVGFDIASRVGLAIPAFSFSEDGQISRRTRNGFSWAAFGTAAAAGRLLGLSADELAHAFGIVYVTTPIHGGMEPFAASIGNYVVPWHKYGMYSAIAEAGVRAAQLAQRGFIASPTIFDEPSEFWRGFTAEGFDWDLLEADLGERWYIEETAIKPYPFCRYGNPMLDLFSSVVRDHELGPDELDEICFTVVPYDSIRGFVEMPAAHSTLETMFCIPHAVAMVALGVPAGPEWSKPHRLAAPEVNAVAGRVTCAVEPSWGPVLEAQVKESGRWGRMPVRLSVSARGQRFEVSTDTARGDPDPANRLSDAELIDKAHRFADEGLTPAGVDALVECVAKADSLSDVAELAEALTRPGRRR